MLYLVHTGHRYFVIAFVAGLLASISATHAAPAISPGEFLARVQHELDSNGVAVLPQGTYTIDGAIRVPKNATLNLNGATINVAYDGPAVVLNGNRAKLKGNSGRIIAATSHTGPIVQVTGGLRFLIDDVWITGKDRSQIGLQIDDLSPTDSTFFGIIRDVQINNIDVGILVSENANGNEILSPLIWQANSCFIRFRGAYANRVIGGFAHGAGSANGTVALELLTGTLNGEPVGSTHNQIIGFAAEPGGTNSSPYTIDSMSSDNQIVAQFNMMGGPIDEGQNNWGVRRGDRDLTSANAKRAAAKSSPPSHPSTTPQNAQKQPPVTSQPQPSEKTPIKRTLFEILRGL